MNNPLLTSVKRQGSVFATFDEFHNSCDDVNVNADTAMKSGLILDYKGNGIVSTSRDESHALIIGASGNGKSRRMIIPSILLMSKTDQSMIITDPKGEIHRYTASYLSQKGYRIEVLNLRSPFSSSRWNPLFLVEKLFRSGNPDQIDRAEVMLSNIVWTLEMATHTEKDPFWEKAAGSIILNVAKLIIQYGPEGSLTFEAIRKVSMDIYQIILENDGKSKLKSKLPSDNPLSEAILSSFSNAPNTLASIMGYLLTMLRNFSEQRGVCQMLSVSDISFDSISETPTAVFIILSDVSSALYPIASIFIEQLYHELIYRADVINADKGGLLSKKVTFMLDELGTLPAIPCLANMIAASRSRGIRFFMAIQTFAQLKNIYSEHTADTIMTNCKVICYLGNRELDFLKQLVGLIGQYRSPYTNETCDLISIQKLQTLKLGEYLILNDRCRPYISTLPDFTEYGLAIQEAEESGNIKPPIRLIDHKVISFEELIRNSERRKPAPDPEPDREPFSEPVTIITSNEGMTEDEEEMLFKTTFKLVRSYQKGLSQRRIASNFISAVVNAHKWKDESHVGFFMVALIASLDKATIQYPEEKRKLFLEACMKGKDSLINQLRAQEDNDDNSEN